MPLLTVSDLHTHYATAGGVLRAVDGVSFTIEAGETVGLVGESGCGKSTLGRTLLGLAPVKSGRIRFEESDIGGLRGAALRPYRRHMQMIFQDPFSALNPRQTIGAILSAPLAVHGVRDPRERLRRVGDIIDRVGLPADAAGRYPHEFSGGQRQRIGIARALILRPRLVICDEPTSALDLSIQAQILNLMADMKGEFGLSYLFVSHDLSVMRYFADRVLIMYLGRIVESGRPDRLWASPRHPYTRALIAAAPDAARRRVAAPLACDVPSAYAIPKGCRFVTRCPLATDICRDEDPVLTELEAGHAVACHHADQAMALSEAS